MISLKIAVDSSKTRLVSVSFRKTYDCDHGDEASTRSFQATTRSQRRVIRRNDEVVLHLFNL